MKAMNQGSDSVSGSWTHSFEEDEPGIQVYRPSEGFAFPPARGRESLDFQGDGALMEQNPGPDDRPRSRAGQWTQLGMNRFALGASGLPGYRVIEVIESSPNILKIRNIPL